jgi:ABC-2 type transport system permease protein
MSIGSSTPEQAPLGPPSGVDSRPPAATGRGSLLAAELGRLRRRRLVVTFVVLGLVALVGAMAIVFATHSTDLAGARAEAAGIAQQEAAGLAEAEAGCRQDPPPDTGLEGCDFGDPPTAEDFFRDPRFFADAGLPLVAMGIGVAGALVGILIGATAVGADWSSRTILTLLTWEPRRLRFLGSRLAAVALGTAALGVLAQALGLGLGTLTVHLRGAWSRPPASSDAVDAAPALLPAAHFWRDLLSLQARCVVLMVLAAVLAASVTAIARHTAGLLGLLFVWFAVVETAVNVLAAARGWPRWLVGPNVLAFLMPGGMRMATGTRPAPNGGEETTTVLVSNLDALLYLGVLAAASVALAGMLLRRRDL